MNYFHKFIYSGNGHLYDGCGLRVTNIDCSGGFTNCGNSIVVPGEIYTSAEEFMNGIPSYGLNTDTGEFYFKFSKHCRGWKV